MIINAGKILLGGVIAVATGAALGVLLAPDKGSTAREKISNQSPRYLGGLKDTASEYGDMLEETYDYVLETANDFTDTVNDTVDV